MEIKFCYVCGKPLSPNKYNKTDGNNYLCPLHMKDYLTDSGVFLPLRESLPIAGTITVNGVTERIRLLNEIPQNKENANRVFPLVHQKMGDLIPSVLLVKRFPIEGVNPCELWAITKNERGNWKRKLVQVYDYAIFAEVYGENKDIIQQLNVKGYEKK